MAQLGVFLIPSPDHPFSALTSAILGYDVWARRRSVSSLAAHLDAATVSGWIGRAAIFGIHCTLAGAALWYDDADLDEIKARLAWIASRTAPSTGCTGRSPQSSAHSLLPATGRHSSLAWTSGLGSCTSGPASPGRWSCSCRTGHS
jgi:hypothetical protein